MKCAIESREHAEMLLAYCGRQLDAAASAVLERHLGDCPACREVVRAQRTVWDALGSWHAVPVDTAGFDRRLYQRIHQEVSWWDRLVRRFRPLISLQGLPAAAAASLLILAAVLVERPATLPMPASPVSAQVEIVAPDQADRALEEMELMREFDRLVHPEAAEPPKL